MQKISTLSNAELHTNTLRAARDEKHATLILLNHLEEIDARRVYAGLGYSSLWEYVYRALGYSESQASERVSAMRLLSKLPVVEKENTKENLESGKISLTNLTQLAYHVKREKLSIGGTLKLLVEIKQKSKREVEKILAKEDTVGACANDQIKVKTKTTTQITIEVEDDFMKQISRIKELKGNLALSPQEIFKIAMDEYIQKRGKTVKISSSG